MTQKLTKNQELAMLDLEVASLKLELLTQTEIAKNNKDAYDKLYEKLNITKGALENSVEYGMFLTKQKLDLEEKNTELINELTEMEGKLLKAQNEIRDQQVKTQTESYLKDKEKARVVELMNGTQLLRQKNLELFNRLKRIPKWVRWIFKYIF